MDALRGSPESFPIRIDGSLGNVEDSDVLVFTGEKVIDRRGFTAADINDRCRASRGRLFDKRKGRLKVWAIPAHCLWSFLCVNLFPMSLHVHTDQRIFIDEVLSMISESQNRGEKDACVGNEGRISRLCVAKSDIGSQRRTRQRPIPLPASAPWYRSRSRTNFFSEKALVAAPSLRKTARSTKCLVITNWKLISTLTSRLPA